MRELLRIFKLRRRLVPVLDSHSQVVPRTHPEGRRGSKTYPLPDRDPSQEQNSGYVCKTVTILNVIEVASSNRVAFCTALRRPMRP